MFKDFKKFILRGNVVDLGVAVVIGAAFNGIVNSLVKDLITPLVGAVYQQKQFATAHFTFRGSQFLYGEFINSIISFVIIALVVFFLVVQPINKLVAISNRDKDTDEPTTKKCPECLSVVPVKATRCAFCATKLKA
ncbi:MAG TPA: large conductance mechanosensitive channel protein MscL [Candidatus Saccharimonadales bacterium]|nr:large conductance mechanosensitive channel protein MscL [Candidatus Saccharimonadales bacterium]